MQYSNGARSSSGLAALRANAPALWLANIAPATNPDWIGRHLCLLSATERARLSRIERPERRAQFFAGHVLLRRLIAARTGMQTREVDVRCESDGRATVVVPPGWRTSVAHSGKWVAVLAEPGAGGAGVDIEFMQPARQIEAIVKVACGIDADSREHAYLVWAQREAEIKAGTPFAGTWVAIWSDHALATCASAVPSAALVDLAADAPAHAVELDWAARKRLPILQDADGN
jgi:4'-phosphopantetheinyl transferase